MIAEVLITAAMAAAAPVETAVADADFRGAVMQTCPEILARGRSFFIDDDRLAATGLTVSPLVRGLIETPGFPVGASGKHVVITLAANIGSRANGEACTVSGLPRDDSTAMRDRLFATFKPTPEQIKDLKRNKYVGFYTGKSDIGLTHSIVFWRGGVYVEKVSR